MSNARMLLCAPVCVGMAAFAGCAADSFANVRDEAGAVSPDAASNPDAASDAGVDATGGGDAAAVGDGASDGGVNLLYNGDFELGDCTGWSSGGSATFTGDSTARSGAWSCRVCYTGADHDAYHVSQPVGLGTQPGERYSATVWLRVADAKPGGSISVNAATRDSTATWIDFDTTPAGALTTTWQPASASVLVMQDGGVDLLLEVKAAVVPPDGGVSCFLIDDATLSRSR